MFVYNFYKFISIPDLSIKKDILLKRLSHLNIKGTILLASEGINVNISQEKQLLDKALKVIDEAIQMHGGMGISQDTPLAHMWTHVRTLRLADGPDAVHRRQVARAELRRYSN